MERIDSVGNIRPQVDVKYGDSCTKYFLRVVLKFHHAGETPTFLFQHGRKEDWHQRPKVFAIIKKHNLRRLFYHRRSVGGNRKLPSELKLSTFCSRLSNVAPNVH